MARQQTLLRFDDFRPAGSVRGRLGILVTPFLPVHSPDGVAFGEVKGSYSYAGREYTTFVGSPGCVS